MLQIQTYSSFLANAPHQLSSLVMEELNVAEAVVAAAPAVVGGALFAVALIVAGGAVGGANAARVPAVGHLDSVAHAVALGAAAAVDAIELAADAGFAAYARVEVTVVLERASTMVWDLEEAQPPPWVPLKLVRRMSLGHGNIPSRQLKLNA